METPGVDQITGETTMTAHQLGETIGEQADLAYYQGLATITTRGRGKQPRAVLVPHPWYLIAKAAIEAVETQEGAGGPTPGTAARPGGP